MLRRIKKDGLKKIRKRRRLLYKPQKKLWKNKNNKNQLLKKIKSFHQIIRKQTHKFKKKLKLKINKRNQNNRQKKFLQICKIIKKLN
jgi:hypothetical protein